MMKFIEEAVQENHLFWLCSTGLIQFYEQKFPDEKTKAFVQLYRFVFKGLVQSTSTSVDSSSEIACVIFSNRKNPSGGHHDAKQIAHHYRRRDSRSFSWVLCPDERLPDPNL
jgi:hypothetical protein